MAAPFTVRCYCAKNALIDAIECNVFALKPLLFIVISLFFYIIIIVSLYAVVKSGVVVCCNE